MGSMAMDQQGNIVLGFSLSGSSLSPQIHYTGRLAGDAPGSMTQGEGTIVNGGGSQSGTRGLSRWGDYSMMGVDPVDDCISTASSTPAGTYLVTVTGRGTSATHTASISLTVSATPPPPPPPGGIVNDGFETGTLSGWTGAGATSLSTTAHSGTWSARVGSTASFKGDSSIAQTFTAPAGSSKLSFWYKVACPDTVTYDWTTATLKDNTAGTTATVLPRTCRNAGTWAQVSGTVTAGHSYTLTLIDHDDNWATDPTYTLYDDVVVQ
jgi:hypothetical protein